MEYKRRTRSDAIPFLETDLSPMECKSSSEFSRLDPQNQELDYVALAAGDVDYRDSAAKPQTGRPIAVADAVSYREHKGSSRQQKEV